MQGDFTDKGEGAGKGEDESVGESEGEGVGAGEGEAGQLLGNSLLMDFEHRTCSPSCSMSYASFMHVGAHPFFSHQT